MFIDPAEANTDDYRLCWDSLRSGAYQAGEFRRIGRGNKEVWLRESDNPTNDMNGKPFKVVKYASYVTAVVGERTRRFEAQKAISLDLEEISRLVDTASELSSTGASVSKQTSTNVQARLGLGGVGRIGWRDQSAGRACVEKSQMKP